MRVDSVSVGVSGRTSSSLSSPTSVMMSSNNHIDGTEKADDCHNKNPRSCILQVGVCAGRLCELANTHPLMNSNNMTATGTGSKTIMNGSLDHHTTSYIDSADNLVTTMADLFVSLWLTSRVLKLNMIVAIQNKLKLNEKKYPVEHCKGKAGKYTQYSHLTGITKTNQVTEVAAQDNKNNISTDPSQQETSLDKTQNIPEWRRVLTLAEVTKEVPRLSETIAAFAEDRLWTRYHTPRNLVMALLGEVGELSELLQFKGDDIFFEVNKNRNEQQQDVTLPLERKELDKLSQELADVSIYLLRLVTVCDVVSPLCDVLEGIADVYQEN